MQRQPDHSVNGETQGSFSSPADPAMPLSVIERVRVGRGSRLREDASAPRLFEEEPADARKRTVPLGKLILGDNLRVARGLLSDYRGSIDLVYVDPPFVTGSDFTMRVPVGDEPATFVNDAAYSDTWTNGLHGYVDAMAARLRVIRELLSSTGTLYVHCDYRTLAHLRLLCDEIFGSDHFLNLVTWRRQIPRGMKAHARHMPFSADYLLMYRHGQDAKWNELRRESLLTLDEAEAKYRKDEKGYFRTSDPGTYSNASLIRLYREGRLHVTKGGTISVDEGRLAVSGGTLGVKYYREQRGEFVVEESVVDNIWDDIPGMGVVSGEHLGYPTQKPEALLRRIIEASSDPGDLVADFFCGSGTTPVVAEKLGRAWIAVDLGRQAVHMTRKRLLGISGVAFEQLTQADDERAWWTRQYESPARAEAKVLSAYGKPSSDVCVVVRVGTADRADILDAINAAVQSQKKSAHVVAWDWGLDVDETLSKAAQSAGVRLSLRQIPREITDPDGVWGPFPIFPAVGIPTCQYSADEGEARIELTGLWRPSDQDVPREHRIQAESWRDYVDYWAIDWNFDGSVFDNQWQEFRMPGDRSLITTARTNDAPGSRPAIKVIDIFGVEQVVALPT